MSSPAAARRAKLENLLAPLTRQELRELKQMMDEDTFQYDILGNLPIELGASIISYLDIVEIRDYRRVSRAWKTLFKQPIVQDNVLQQWITPAKAFLPGTGSDRDEHFCRYIRSARSFLTAKPHHSFFFQFSRSASYRHDTIERIGPMKFFDCSHGLLALAVAIEDQREDTLRIFDFKGHRQLAMRTPGREAISCLSVTSDYVGYVTSSGTCYAISRHSLDPDEAISVTLPSTNIRAFCGRDAYFSILMRTHEVFMWNVDQNSLRFFMIPDHIGMPGLRTSLVSTASKVELLPAKDGESVTLFILSATEVVLDEGSADADARENDWLYAIRLGTTGHVLTTDVLQTKRKHPQNWPRSIHYSLGIRTCNRQGSRYAVCIAEPPTSNQSPAAILFDEARDKLSWGGVVSTDTESQTHHNGPSSHMLWDNILVTAQRTCVGPGKGYTKYTVQCDGLSPANFVYPNNLIDHNDLDVPIRLLGDDSMIVSITQDQAGDRQSWNAVVNIFDPYLATFQHENLPNCSLPKERAIASSPPYKERCLLDARLD